MQTLYGGGTGGFVQDILFDVLVVCAAVLGAKGAFELLRRSETEKDGVTHTHTHTHARAHTHTHTRARARTHTGRDR